MNKITKGPWEVVRPEPGCFTIRGKNNDPVVWQFGGVGEEADAQLIAAAPDLLAALVEAVEKYGKPGGPWNVPSDPGGWITRARLAIEKAKKGEKPCKADRKRKPSTISPSRRSSDE